MARHSARTQGRTALFPLLRGALGLAVGLSALQACVGGEAFQASGAAATSAGTTGGAGGTGGGATTDASSASTGGSGGSSSTGSEGGGGCAAPMETPGFPAEIEPNDDTASPMPLAEGVGGVWGALCPAGDVDVFSVSTPGGQSLRVALTDGLEGCPAGFLPAVEVLDAAGAVLAEDTGFGCLTLDPLTSPALASLAAGTYRVVVQNAGPLAVNAYRAEIAFASPGCGDGVVQFDQGEQCDDANGVTEDGCADCALDGGYVNEVESNDTPASGTTIDGAPGAVGSLAGGDVDYYLFKVSVDGSSLRADVSDGLGGCPPGLATYLTLFGLQGAALATDAGSGLDACSALDPITYPAVSGLTAGTYVLSVSEVNGLPAASYVLSVSVVAPGCGDGLLDVGEQCDDGNRSDGDGCNSGCKSESPWEIEPNGTAPEATAFWPGSNGWYGAIQPIGDLDHFSFTVAGGADVTLETTDLGSATCLYDTWMRVYDGAGNEIASDDDGGIGQCSKLTPAANAALTNMPAGTYTVLVQERFDGAVIPGYELHFLAQ